MGRNKIDKTQTLDTTKQIQLAYSKRKRTVLKMCIKLSNVCNQDISLTIFDRQRQKLVQYSSSYEFNPKIASELLYPENIILSTCQIYTNDSYDQLCNIKPRSTSPVVSDFIIEHAPDKKTKTQEEALKLLNQPVCISKFINSENSKNYKQLKAYRLERYKLRNINKGLKQLETIKSKLSL